MTVTTAKTAGFCFGVKRAVNRAFDLLRDGVDLCSIGPLIHNPDVVAEMTNKGLRVVSSPADIMPSDHVLIRTHGIGKSMYSTLEDTGAKIIDTTCPFVKKIHQIVSSGSQKGKKCIVIGDKTHPEVEGIVGWCADSFVTTEPCEIETYFRDNDTETTPVCVVSQTTMDRQVFDICVSAIKKLYTNAEFFDTICNATTERQTEAEQIASQSDMMIVIGGFESANTKMLCEICRRHCKKVIHIERAGQVGHIPEGVGKVGITAGASTPSWIIKEVVSRMSEENIIEETGESFAEMLEQCIKTLYTRERVTGVITGMTSTEIQVDLGTKHAGYIPMSEYSDDPNAKPEAELKIGDEIECIVTRVNDVEGTAQLSKKQLDAVKNWATVEAACEHGIVLEGTVVEDNKGGIVVSVLGVRVFVPMSQTGLPKDAPASSMIKKTVRLRITEINRQRRRVIGSIRSVISEERRLASEKIWDAIEPGAKFVGAVKSITNYGVFVDIGGVDGMVHVSELSWKRIRHPSDVMNIGDEVEVYVISADPEKKKISLGYKKATDNPWAIFAESYKKGDIVTVKVVKLMPFGAFAEIIPGIDGLIHISQISDRRITRPGEVLNEGMQVDVVITDIDLDARKISLSIRALTDNPAEPLENFVKEPAGIVEDAVVASADDVEA